MQAFIVTLCGLLSYRGLARFVTADNSRGFSGDSAFMERVAPLKQMATGLVHLPGNFAVPIPFLVFIVVAVVMWVVLHRSVYGRYLFAVGRNEEAARYSGIPTRWVIGSAYVVSGALAGVSGVMLAFYSNSVSPATHGSFYELYGIAAAVLGGCSLMGGEGSIVGVVIGTALLQVLRNIVNMLNIPSSLEFTLMGVVILLGVLADQIITQRRKRRLAG
jgi:ribose transport system permease protein